MRDIQQINANDYLSGRYKLFYILVHVSYLIFSSSGKALSWGYVINQVLN